MKLRDRIRTGFIEYFGRQPSEYELDEAVRGYHDQQERDAALEAAGLSEEQLALAVEADLDGIIRGISGLPPKVQ